MSRYIDADKLLTDEFLHTLPIGRGRLGGRVVVFADDIENQPLADVEEVRHGRWIWEFNLDGDDFFVCSVCGDQVVLNGLCKERSPAEHYPYCHCGAKMDRERSENGKS